MQLSRAERTRFVEGVSRLFGGEPGFLRRLELTLPLYGIRWVLIVLNEFVPASWTRRGYSGKGGDWTTVKNEQLSKSARYAHCRTFVSRGDHRLTAGQPARAELDERSKYLRSLIIDGLSAGRGHVGSPLSIVEILRVLYDDVLDVRPTQPDWPERDRFILSKGHGCLALYAILADHGFFPKEELKRFCKPNALLGGHVDAHIPGIEASTGALGHGLPIGVGMALAARMRGRKSRVFVVTGDGELGEGSIWEAALAAAKHGLQNLTVIVDYNKLQSYGRIEDVLPLEPLADKWRAFGFAVREVDGHDLADLRRTFAALPFEVGKPNVVVAHTLKGRGISFAELNASWHHKSSLDAAAIEKLRDALASE